jgi:hypothetical protein
MAIADYTYDTLPAAERAAMPPADDLTAVLDTPFGDQDSSPRLADALPSDEDDPPPNPPPPQGRGR